MKKKSGWIDVNKGGHPKPNTIVIAHFKGVYGYRLVEFWVDGMGNPRYGSTIHPDGQGSRPATHWHPLPPLPR